jgi:hypothetical protein
MKGFIAVEALLDYPTDPTKTRRVLVALSALTGVVEHTDTCTIGVSSLIHVSGASSVISIRVGKTYEEVIDLIKLAQ